MIIYTMTDEEIYAEIQKDFSNLNDKIRFCEGKFQVALKKCTRFPFMQSYQHVTNERHNKYVITYTARSINDKNHPLISIYCLYRDRAGEAAASINWMMGVVTLYQNHFFNRYRERVLKNESISIENTIEAFFKQEWSLFGIPITKELEDVFHCFEGHFSDDEVNVLLCVEDGYAFGIRKENLFIVKTIITDELLSDNQRVLFSQLRDHYRNLNCQLY